jgi:poly(glycerol-phosphate) alpha-glucosyltransferase
MKVAFVVASISQAGGGVAVAAGSLARTLAADGLQLDVLATCQRDEACAVGIDTGAADVRLSRCVGPRKLRLAPALPAALQKTTADVVHLHGLWQFPSLAVARWRQTTGRPVLISPHGMLEPWAVRNSGRAKQLAACLFERRNLAQAACLHALHPGELADLRSAGLRAPVAVIPNGVDIPAERARCGRRGPRTLLYLGRLHAKKGLPLAIEAWRRFRADAPERASGWQFVIRGWDDGGHAADLQAQIAAGGGAALGIVLGGPAFGAQKEALLADADAVILPSFSEGLPMTVLEAWAHGVPTLMTSAANLPEGFAAGAAIEITPDADQIAQVLDGHLTHEVLTPMRAAARHLAQSRFSWTNVARHYLDVYRWLAGHGDRPACVDLAPA